MSIISELYYTSYILSAINWKKNVISKDQYYSNKNVIEVLILSMTDIKYLNLSRYEKIMHYAFNTICALCQDIIVYVIIDKFSLHVTYMYIYFIIVTTYIYSIAILKK